MLPAEHSLLDALPEHCLKRLADVLAFWDSVPLYMPLMLKRVHLERDWCLFLEASSGKRSSDTEMQCTLTEEKTNYKDLEESSDPQSIMNTNRCQWWDRSCGCLGSHWIRVPNDEKGWRHAPLGGQMETVRVPEETTLRKPQAPVLENKKIKACNRGYQLETAS